MLGMASRNTSHTQSKHTCQASLVDFAPVEKCLHWHPLRCGNSAVVVSLRLSLCRVGAELKRNPTKCNANTKTRRQCEVIFCLAEHEPTTEACSAKSNRHFKFDRHGQLDGLVVAAVGLVACDVGGHPLCTDELVSLCLCAQLGRSSPPHVPYLWCNLLRANLKYILFVNMQCSGLSHWYEVQSRRAGLQPTHMGLLQ